MNNIYIQKLRITGKGKLPAEIEFVRGLNIIYGPSNTGKTYILQCIDYLFGAKDNPISREHGYDCITIEVNTGREVFAFSRKLDSNKINVEGIDSPSPLGEYHAVNRQKYEKSINSLWFDILGIKEKHYVIKNENFEKQTLTLRTFIHMFLLSEERMISKGPIVYSGITTAKTAEISALLFLLDGKDRGIMDSKDKISIKEAKKEVVINYINHEIVDFSKRRKDLLEQKNNTEELDDKITSILSELSDTEKAVSKAIQGNQCFCQPKSLPL
ncbi:MAG: AAA family ATPase [Actinobacteria bacterium]|nr:AAA family ATPase [Actinomycetota bacterium]